MVCLGRVGVQLVQRVHFRACLRFEKVICHNPLVHMVAGPVAIILFSFHIFIQFVAFRGYHDYPRWISV